MTRYASETSVSVEKSHAHDATRRYRDRQRQQLISERERRMVMRSSPPIDECAWAAGLFEGEGTITMCGAARPRLTVMMTSTDPEIIEFFQVRWPGILRTYQPKGNAKLATSWTLASRDALEYFLRDIEFYVRSERVRSKLRLALEESADRFPARRGELIRARSAARKAEFLRLNRRGTVPAQTLLEGPR